MRSEREKNDVLRERLLSYPGASDESVEQQISAYAEREKLKRDLVGNRGMSNALAETFLDRSGYPRPPGWHSVFFYPGSSRPRNGYLVILLVALVTAVFLRN